jgi:hypothetical protein
VSIGQHGRPSTRKLECAFRRIRPFSRTCTWQKQAEQGQCYSREIDDDQSIAKDSRIWGEQLHVSLGALGFCHAPSIYSRLLCLISPQIPCQSLSAHSPRPTGGLRCLDHLVFCTIMLGYLRKADFVLARRPQLCYRQATFTIIHMLHKAFPLDSKLLIGFNCI